MTYKTALEADLAYEKAIKKQFGADTNSFDRLKSEYNQETMAAYEHKVSCDDELRTQMATRGMR